MSNSLKHTPLVSVIIPAFNSMTSSKNIEQTLKSIVNQTYENIEVLVIDNFSSDSTPEVCKQYPIRFFQVEGNRSKARNFGIEEMKGDYALFVDSDHILDAKVVEECVSQVTHAGAECIIIPVIFVNTVESRLDCSQMRNLEFRVDLGTQTLVLFYSRILLSGISFPEDVELGEDMIFSSEVLAKKPTVARIHSAIRHLEEGSVRNVILRSWSYGKKFGSTISEIGSRNSTWFILSISPFAIGRIRKIVVNVSDSPATFLGFSLYTVLKHFSFAISYCIHHQKR